jgi:hypothetical protein
MLLAFPADDISSPFPIRPALGTRARYGISPEMSKDAWEAPGFRLRKRKIARFMRPLSAAENCGE